ncbi:AraC family transcriptional regulator [Dyadobacter sp. CY345]|uniref:AraC family transcriptional regulator n=1 Tax=Dyadobacter sp. CY345 TaxID=2909335 RepID=UPI001F3579B3|nr:helix-turn-helix domain-containing protein [Dyadobacter sp. CY345]MCF2446857.1 AraC family transcriptional regulator [Dyadobacter sp. CY345]
MQTNIPRVDISTLSAYRDDDILISRFAPYLAIHPNLTSPHRHSFYHLLFFSEGGGKHTIDFNHFSVKPYQIYFMVPGQVHSWDFEGNVDGYVVNFSSSFLQSFLLKSEYISSFTFFSGGSTESVIDLPEAVQQPIRLLFEKLVIESQQQNVLKNDMLRVLLIQIFITVQQSLSTDQRNSTPFQAHPVLKNFQKLIENNYLEIRLPGEYAQLLHITPNHLNAICKEHLGIQAGEIIRDRVVLEAKRLLVNLSLSISEIAYKLNFNDNSYFTKFFKKEVGMSPEVFRKKSLSKN